MKEKILEILDGNSSKFRLNYFKNNYPELLKEIEDFCKDVSDLPFVQKVWHICNNKPNYIKCACGNDVSFNRNWLDGYKYGCSAKCTQANPLTKEKRKKTTIDTYGVDNIAKLQESKDKVEVTNLERYGTKSSFQNEEVKEKWKKGIQEKYGVDHVFQLDSIKDKSKETCLDKYGKEYYVQTDEYLEKSKEKNLERYGKEWYTQSEDYKIKSKETNNKLYGVDYYFQSKDYKDIMNSDEYHQRSKEKYFNESKVKYSDDRYELIERDASKLTFLDKQYKETFHILYDCYMKRKERGYEISTIRKPLYSSEEYHKEFLEIIEFIQSLGIEFKINDRKFINPKEIDILIDSHKLCLEYNGLWWHGEFKIDTRFYHTHKHDRCKENGYGLINIWEDDWIYKKDIVKSIIKNRLGKSEHKVYTRLCEIKSVNRTDTKLFLNMNHIQGESPSNYNYGLYNNGQLVSLMTFGLRYITGKESFELIRFCNKIGYNVPGSGSRLLKYAISNIEFVCKELVSYCDLSMFVGEFYTNLGFDHVHRTEPNYWWVVGSIRKNRFNYNKKKLVRQGHDPNKTEVEIMHSLKHHRIFGVGMDKYILKIE